MPFRMCTGVARLLRRTSAAAIVTLAAIQPALTQTPPPIPVPNRAFVAMIDSFFAHPIGSDLIKPIKDSVTIRPDVFVAISTGVMPWRCYADTNRYVRYLDVLLIAGYIAGDARHQLVSGVKGSNAAEGIRGILSVYAAIRRKIPNYEIPEVRAWAAQRESHGLETVADSIAQTRSPNCDSPPYPARFHPGATFVPIDSARPHAR